MFDITSYILSKKFTSETAEGAGAVQGKPGKDGNGIVSITKESSTGKIDTYKIFFTDNTSTKFTVTNATTVENLSQLNNDTGFINNTATNLVNYYTKADTYSKDEISRLLQNIGAGLSVMVVSDLPTENINATTIYLVNEGIDNNSYEQWMYIAGQWASLGSTTIDLSAYYTKNNIDHLLLGYITASSLTTILANYVKKAELSSVATSGSYNDLKDLPTIPTTEGLATEKYVDDAIQNIHSNNVGSVDLSDYYKKTETYSKSEVDNLIPDVTEGLSHTIVENSNNTDKIYKLDITDANGAFTTPNLKGANGKDGKSISAISKDENNNIIVTFSDGSTQNIGKLNIDVSADFLTPDGFGNLRYYNGHFQFYDASTSSWIDTNITPDNVYIINMTPQPMQFINGVFDVELGKYKLKWLEPEDTIIEGQVACIVEKVIIKRKLGSVPVDENDGDLVVEIMKKQFGTYKNSYFIDNELTPNEGDIYYYKAFPVNTTGFYNTSSMNEIDGILCKKYSLYGFKIDQNESDPASMITYIEDNADFKSARMNYTLDTFDYGDWKDAFFMKVRPCMLKYDGTVDYYLNPNDYTLKEDGTPSDVADVNYGGNAMIQFPKVYWKIVDNGDNSANIYISNKKIDDNFHCWSHIDNKGNEIPYCYMPIYNGYSDGTRLRSLSGKTPSNSKTAETEINLAKSNNQTNEVIWYTEVFSDRQLVNLLLLLIGKSTNTQNVFGNGHYTGNNNVSSLIISGSMNSKGLFYGTNGSNKGVKIFGIEHWWGNQFRRIAGWINYKGQQKIKMTYGQLDGSTIDGYNTTANGYIAIANTAPNGTSGGYITKMTLNEYGLIPKTSNGSATTYYSDGLWYDNAQICYPLTGGCPIFGLLTGAFSVHIRRPVSLSSWEVGASISCKPLAETGGVS